MTFNLAYAQQWKWAASAGGGGNTGQNYDMATDSHGNVYWLGSVSGNVSFGSAILSAPSGKRLFQNNYYHLHN